MDTVSLVTMTMTWVTVDTDIVIPVIMYTDIVVLVTMDTDIITIWYTATCYRHCPTIYCIVCISYKSLLG